MAKANTKKMQSQMKINSKISAQDAIGMGIQAVEKGNRQEAYNIFEQTSKLHPDTSEVWVWLGGASPDLESAEAAFEKAYALDPNNEQASLGLRWVRLKRKVSLADIVGATVPVPTAPPEAGQWQTEQPQEPQSVPVSSDMVEPQPVQQIAEQDAAAQADAPESKSGLGMRTMIIVAVLVVIMLVALGAFWYLRIQ